MLEPTFADAQYNLANVMLELKSPEAAEEAIFHYNQVIALDQLAAQKAAAAAEDGDELPSRKPLLQKKFALCNLGKAFCFHLGDSDKGTQCIQCRDSLMWMCRTQQSGRGNSDG